MWAFVIPSPQNMAQREPYELGEAHSDSARCHGDPILFFLAGSDSEATHGTLLRSDAIVTRHFECERPGGRQDSGTLSYLEACFLTKVSLARAFTNRGWAGGKRKIAERVCRRSAPRLRGRILFAVAIYSSVGGLERNCFRHLSDCRGWPNNGCGFQRCLSRFGLRFWFWLRSDCTENHGGGTLHDFQALLQ